MNEPSVAMTRTLVAAVTIPAPVIRASTALSTWFSVMVPSAPNLSAAPTPRARTVRCGFVFASTRTSLVCEVTVAASIRALTTLANWLVAIATPSAALPPEIEAPPEIATIVVSSRPSMSVARRCTEPLATTVPPLM